MANPPFNISDWNRREGDSRWAYGVPPAGNANYAWLQHIVSHLAPGGTAGVVMANGSMTSNSGGEGEIRAQLVENDLVSCMVALPEKLFRSTGIPVCLWFFAKDKSAGPGGTIDRRGEVLFIDARQLGHMVTRAERAFSDEDIAKIADTFHAWRGVERATALAAPGDAEPVPASEAALTPYEDVPGYCRSVAVAEIKDASYALTPGRFVGVAERNPSVGDPRDRIEVLRQQLVAQFDEASRLQSQVATQFARLK